MITRLFLDFDDTIYLKKQRQYIPQLERLLRFIKAQHIRCVIVTCNHKVNDLIAYQPHPLLHEILDGIIYVKPRLEKKSDHIGEFLRSLPGVDPSTCLFFDNDPFHIYDVSRHCNVRSFNVHPNKGVDIDFLEAVVNATKDADVCKIRWALEESIKETSTHYFLERYRLSQNLGEVDKMMSCESLSSSSSSKY